MKFFTREVKIALVAIVGIILLFFGVNFLKGMNLFKSDDVYYITFDNIQGLAKSTPVYADGYKIGTVSDIQYNYGRNSLIKVGVSVSKDMRIPKGSTAEIEKDLMGNMQVDILMANNPRERVKPGSIIPGNLATGIMSQVSDVIPQVKQMIPKLDSIMDNLNRILANPAIAASLGNIQQTTANLTVSTRELNTLLTGLNKSVPGMIDKADGVLDNTHRLTGKLADIDIAGTMAQVNATLVNAKEFTEKLNHNEGTLSKLMNDDDLYNNLNATMKDADSLVVNLKQHPKRYVHFSLFGKKDK
ncbi:MAG TPA: MCE family protein [Prevotella sp.]|nr:MCE family protein [Prevotella sp.]